MVPAPRAYRNGTRGACFYRIWANACWTSLIQLRDELGCARGTASSFGDERDLTARALRSFRWE